MSYCCSHCLEHYDGHMFKLYYVLKYACMYLYTHTHTHTNIRTCFQEYDYNTYDRQCQNQHPRILHNKYTPILRIFTTLVLNFHVHFRFTNNQILSPYNFCIEFQRRHAQVNWNPLSITKRFL